MNVTSEVDVWSGDWSLPSIDISCLQIMTYCKFSGLPLVTKEKNNPLLCNLPTFRHGNKKFHSLKDVAAHLKTQNFDLDHFLSKKDLSDAEAYTQLLKEKLYPALKFIWWVDNKNFVELSRPWYAKKLPFPLNFYYPGHYMAKAKDTISCLYGSLEENYELVETKVYGEAEKCLNLLSNKLGDSKFFFGNQPSSLDAIIFSYLAPLLKAPFPNPVLQNHLKLCPNLVNFVNTIMEKYYSTLIKEYEKTISELQRRSVGRTFLYKSRHQIVACLTALTAMLVYTVLAPEFLWTNITIQNEYFEEEVD